MMAWGIDCSSWEYSVDWANIEKYDPNEISKDGFVMTTWHEHEPLSETLWHCKYCAVHPTVEIFRTLLVHVSEISKEQEFLQAYAEA